MTTTLPPFSATLVIASLTMGTAPDEVMTDTIIKVIRAQRNTWGRATRNSIIRASEHHNDEHLTALIMNALDH